MMLKLRTSPRTLVPAVHPGRSRSSIPNTRRRRWSDVFSSAASERLPVCSVQQVT